MDPNSKSLYKVRSLDTRIGAHDIWDGVEVMDHFVQPWTKGPVQNTGFSAVYNESSLFLRYVVEDSSILVYRDVDDKLEVASSDRVEIFFMTDDALERYYCLEIDPLGRILDYKASFYRNFDYGWDWPKGQLSSRAELYKEGYIVELVIGLDSLRNLGILKNGIIGAGIFRGDCKDLGNPKGTDPKINWISWIDPRTEIPDFHVPTAFGQLTMMDPADQR